MLLDILSWAQHEGAIYSVHAQPKGLRFATGGIDQKVKIWNLPAALDANVEVQPSTNKLLATLVEHTGAVNVVRFSYDGKLLASGSDDFSVIIYHQLAGAGGTTLGSTTSSVENWRPKLMLRGHASNISDLAWSHDNSKLATASTDCSVIVWDMAAGGGRLATLTAQRSFVKGVQWDPVGSYLAAQSDDHTVVVYSTADWAPLATIDKPYKRSITDTFATRLSFSPEGQWLLTGNAFQQGNHCAVIIKREQWQEASEYNFLSGHTGAVVSTAFNPKLFHLPVAKEGPSNGKPAAFQEHVTPILATAGNDRRVVVWSAAGGAPLFAGKALFKQGVADVSWTSDGYTLLACSTDGTVGVFQFSQSELGRAASEAEMEEALRDLYGGRQRGEGGALLFAESVEQLEADGDQLAAAPQGQPDRLAAAAPTVLGAQQLAGDPEGGKAPDAWQAALAPSNRSLPAVWETRPATKPAAGIDLLEAKLAGRMGAGGETQVGFGGAAGSAPLGGAASAAQPAPLRNGQKRRLAPEPVNPKAAPAATITAAAAAGAGPGDPARGGAMPPPPTRQPSVPPASGGAAAPAAKRQRQALASGAAGPSGRATGAGPAAALAARAPNGHLGAAGAAAGLPQPSAGAAGLPPGAAGGAWGPVQVLQAADVRQDWSVQFQGEERRQQQQAGASWEGEGAPPPPRELRIANRDRGLGGRPHVELMCLRGQQAVWADLLAGQAVCACATQHFAAVGLQDGSLVLYSPAGRRLGGCFKLGAGLARLACDGAWLLLAITTTGRVKLLHVGQQRALLNSTLGPLVEDGSQLVDARLSRQGWPMLTLSSHRAYVWHPGMEEWMCVAEEAYSGTPYIPSIALPSQGELAGLQMRTLAGSQAVQPRSLLNSRPTQQQQSRALLESNLAAALCLQSPQEYRRALRSYAQLLSESGDLERLRELCMELLGPPFPPAGHPASSPPELDQQLSDTARVGVPDMAGSGMSAHGSGWQPRLLDLDKREDLLVGEVLPVLGRSRAAGVLAQELRDVLSDLQHMVE